MTSEVLPSWPITPAVRRLGLRRPRSSCQHDCDVHRADHRRQRADRGEHGHDRRLRPRHPGSPRGHGRRELCGPRACRRRRGADDVHAHQQAGRAGRSDPGPASPTRTQRWSNTATPRRSTLRSSTSSAMACPTSRSGSPRRRAARVATWRRHRSSPMRRATRGRRSPPTSRPARLRSRSPPAYRRRASRSPTSAIGRCGCPRAAARRNLARRHRLRATAARHLTDGAGKPLVGVAATFIAPATGTSVVLGPVAHVHRVDRDARRRRARQPARRGRGHARRADLRLVGRAPPPARPRTTTAWSAPRSPRRSSRPPRAARSTTQNRRCLFEHSSNSQDRTLQKRISGSARGCEHVGTSTARTCRRSMFLAWGLDVSAMVLARCIRVAGSIRNWGRASSACSSSIAVASAGSNVVAAELVSTLSAVTHASQLSAPCARAATVGTRRPLRSAA